MKSARDSVDIVKGQRAEIKRLKEERDGAERRKGEGEEERARRDKERDDEVKRRDDELDKAKEKVELLEAVLGEVKEKQGNLELAIKVKDVTIEEHGKELERYAGVVKGLEEERGGMRDDLDR